MGVAPFTADRYFGQTSDGASYHPPTAGIEIGAGSAVTFYSDWMVSTFAGFEICVQKDKGVDGALVCPMNASQGQSPMMNLSCIAVGGEQGFRDLEPPTVVPFHVLNSRSLFTIRVKAITCIF